MKGNNELTLNGATMMEIVQYWLDNKFTNPDDGGPYVVAFKNGRDGNTWVVELSSDPK